MKAERQRRVVESRTIQPKREKSGGVYMVDNRDTTQMKPLGSIQRVGLFGEEEAVQGKFVTQLQPEDEDLLQGKFVTQLQPEDEELLQGKFDTIQQKSNNTGLPDNLKSGVESMSGFSMDDVRVHYNSAKPTQMQAHAYAQGTDIHVASGQEKHLPHEAWHIVQQKQGRVQPTTQLQGVNVNNDTSLEIEADIMGGQAVQARQTVQKKNVNSTTLNNKTIQKTKVVTIEQVDALGAAIPSTLTTDAQKISKRYAAKDIGAALGAVPGAVPGVANALRNEYYNHALNPLAPVPGPLLTPANLVAINAPNVRDLSTINPANPLGLGVNERLVLVAHGTRSTNALVSNSTYGGRTEYQLAIAINLILPPNYSGDIYLDGCHTAEPIRRFFGGGTSFAEKIKAALIALGQTRGFTVKGNLGRTKTVDSGKDGVEMDTISRRLQTARMAEIRVTNPFYPSVERRALAGIYNLDKSSKKRY